MHLAADSLKTRRPTSCLAQFERIFKMRLDKLTTAFQQALADGQSAAVARENPYVEPAHVLAAMLPQPDAPKPLLDRAGHNTPALKTAMDTLVPGLPQVQGGGQVSGSRDLLQ